MSTYVLLYSGGQMAATESERKKSNDEWNAWFKKLDKAVIDQGNPFAPMAKSLWSDGRIHDDADCPSASGYSIIRAASYDAALQLAKSCPGLRNGTKISIYETIPTM